MVAFSLAGAAAVTTSTAKKAKLLQLLVISISPLPSSCKLVNVDAMLLEMLL
jgi:hypothetical protein